VHINDYILLNICRFAIQYGTAKYSAYFPTFEIIGDDNALIPGENGLHTHKFSLCINRPLMSRSGRLFAAHYLTVAGIIRIALFRVFQHMLLSLLVVGNNE